MTTSNVRIVSMAKVKMKDIDTLILDCDGTLTDGMFLVSDRGSVSKNFNTKDFVAIYEWVVLEGNRVAIISGSSDKCAQAKMDCLEWVKDYPDRVAVFSGVLDKKGHIGSVLGENTCCLSYPLHQTPRWSWDFTWDNVAYMGDQTNDLSSMAVSAITGCPIDAHESIIEESDMISEHKGGGGCVAEFIQWILACKGQEEKDEKNV